jgi:hypothetical protein
MKWVLTCLLVAGVGFGAGSLLSRRHIQEQHQRQLAVLRTQFDAEKTELETSLEKARMRPRDFLPRPVSTEPERAESTQSNGQELLDRLIALRLAPPPNAGRTLRPVLGLMDQLAHVGSPALPVLRQFLASNQDVSYEAVPGKTRDIEFIANALVPPSLRMGLFDVLREIGGAEAEQILAENLSRTGRGMEVAYLANLLEAIAPGRYRDAALLAARDLLGRTGSERDYLYALLKRFHDASYVATAQSQLVQPDGKLDVNALRYLQQTLGEQSVAIAAQAYKEARLVDADSKEPLARLALAYVGTSAQAAELFHTAILDPTLKPGHHRNLIEDLNEDGLRNKKAPSPEDLQVIANRYALTQAYLQQDYVQNNKLLNEAFREADKDLRNMLQRSVVFGTGGAGAVK